MILSGSKIYGYNYIGLPTLATIAAPVCWYDWRFGRVDGFFSGATRAITLSDLSTNNFLLEGASVSSGNTRPMVLPDGLGMDDSVATKNAVVFRRNGSNSKYEVLHKGAPFLIMCVIKPIVLSSNINLMATTLSGAKAGFRMRFVGATGLLASAWFNDAGASVANAQTPSSSVATGSFYFIAAQYYGSGTGSNNFKMWINNTQYTFTVNPTFGTGPCDGLYSWHGAGGVASSAFEFSQKLAITYDLTGKSTAQIDAFRTIAINTLKNDPEYASLTTP